MADGSTTFQVASSKDRSGRLRCSGTPTPCAFTAQEKKRIESDDKSGKRRRLTLEGAGRHEVRTKLRGAIEELTLCYQLGLKLAIGKCRLRNWLMCADPTIKRVSPNNFVSHHHHPPSSLSTRVSHHHLRVALSVYASATFLVSPFSAFTLKRRSPTSGAPHFQQEDHDPRWHPRVCLQELATEGVFQDLPTLVPVPVASETPSPML